MRLREDGQASVYLWKRLKVYVHRVGGRRNSLPEMLIDENENRDRCSAIMRSPLKKTEGRIELDKSSEKKVPLKNQAGLTTQLPSALIYLLFGRSVNKVLSELSSMPDNLPYNLSI